MFEDVFVLLGMWQVEEEGMITFCSWLLVAGWLMITFL
jgi:hypothetical protein